MIEIRTFDGDSRDAAAFTTSIWKGTYGGHHQFPVWDERYYDWQLFGRADSDRSLTVAAYDSGELVGTLFAEPFRFSFEGRELEGSTSSWLTVDPRTRGRFVGRKLVDELRRRHRDRGLAFSLGFAITGTNGPSFWDTMPDTIIFGKMGYWVRVLDARAVTDWLPGGWERAALKVLGPFVAPLGQDRNITGMRPFLTTDLDRCLELTRAMARGSGIGLVWTRQRLHRQLDYRETPQTLVFERGGIVRGMINYYCMDFLLRANLRIGQVDLLACGELDQGERRDLIEAALARMKSEGVALVVVPRMSGCPAGALVRNRFVPLPAELVVTGIFPDGSIPRRKFNRYQLVVR